MKIIVDAMGGDNAPLEIVRGALNAAKARPGLEIVLVGREDEVPRYANWTRYSTVHSALAPQSTSTSPRPARQRDAQDHRGRGLLSGQGAQGHVPEKSEHQGGRPAGQLA